MCWVSLLQIHSFFNLCSSWCHLRNDWRFSFVVKGIKYLRNFCLHSKTCSASRALLSLQFTTQTYSSWLITCSSLPSYKNACCRNSFRFDGPVSCSFLHFRRWMSRANKKFFHRVGAFRLCQAMTIKCFRAISDWVCLNEAMKTTNLIKTHSSFFQSSLRYSKNLISFRLVDQVTNRSQNLYFYRITSPHENVAQLKVNSMFAKKNQLESAIGTMIKLLWELSGRFRLTVDIEWHWTTIRLLLIKKSQKCVACYARLAFLGRCKSKYLSI